MDHNLNLIETVHLRISSIYPVLDSKLEQKDQIELHTKPKAEPKKITSFQVTLTLMLDFIFLNIIKMIFLLYLK